MSAPTVTPELKALLRRVKLGRCLDTLPERLALAHTGQMGHGGFLELVLADEVTRREFFHATLGRPSIPIETDLRLRQTGRVRLQGTGAERRISCAKRDFGLSRTRIDGLAGARTWCGHGIFAHNLVKIGGLID